MSDDRLQSSDAAESVAGKWHLLDLAADETHVPHHRVDLVFHADADQLRGAILSRGSGAEIPLASVQLDGDTLRFDVSDDGVGGATERPGGGLAGLADRASAVEGTLRVTSPAGGPTVVAAELPCGS